MREPPENGLSPLNLSIGGFLPLTRGTTHRVTSKTRCKESKKVQTTQEDLHLFSLKRYNLDSV